MEAAGGHTLLKHQNQTNQKLTRRAIKEPANASTFTDKKTALKAVQENLRNNADAIAAWVKSNSVQIEKRFEFTHRWGLGRGVYEEKNN